MVVRGLVVAALAVMGLVAAAMGPARAQAQDGMTDLLVYSKQAAMLMGMVSATTTDLVAANETMLEDMTDRAAMAEVFAETGVFEAVYEAAKEMEPPTIVEPAHDELLQGLELLAESGPIIRDGLVRLDGARIAEATAMVQEANGHIAEATRLIKEATPGE